MTAELLNLRVALVGTGNVPLVFDIERAVAPLQYLYGNISETARGYFLHDSGDDVRNFELPRLGKSEQGSTLNICIVLL